MNIHRLLASTCLIASLSSLTQVRAESCADIYEQTAKSFREAAADSAVVGLFSPVIGAVGAAGTGIYYAGKETRDAANIVIGTEAPHDSRADAAERVIIGNPKGLVTGVAAFALLAGFGLPVGAFASIHYYRRSRQSHKIANALKEIVTLDAGRISEDTKLAKPLDALHKTINRRAGLLRYKKGHSKYVNKQTFVGLLTKLSDNRGICPQDSIYSIRKLKKIIRGFALGKEAYQIPQKVYKKSIWFKDPFGRHITPEDVKKYFRKTRMRAVKKSEELQKLYQGLAPAYGEEPAISGSSESLSH